MPRPKPSKPAGKLFTQTSPPQVGDKVIPNDSQLVFEIIKIHSDGELTLNAPGTCSIASGWTRHRKIR